MQEKNGGSVFRSRLSVEDGEPVDLHCPIKHLLFHGFLLFLSIGTQGSGEHDREGHQRPNDRFILIHMSSDLLSFDACFICHFVHRSSEELGLQSRRPRILASAVVSWLSSEKQQAETIGPLPAFSTP